ncbi:hypothetical protein [Methyloglobulus sp.]|uniref:hypothetical protein n=1 Tax=Methyloglobulus sp. TaxID=2518622 RepID=UPI00398A2BC5
MQNFDLGILYVHGIGTQKKGETLLAFGEPMIYWLNQWFSGETLEKDSPVINFETASLEGDRPAHVGLTLKAVKADETNIRFLLAECWWANEVQVPRFSDMIVWLFKIAPSLTIMHFWDKLNSTKCNWEVAKENRWRKLSDLAGLFMQFCFVVIMILPLMVGLQMVALICVLLPIPFFQKAAQLFQNTLSNVLGDSYVLVKSRIQETAILTRLKSDIDWLQNEYKCKKICVVAHSQGAAVAYRLLNAQPELFKEIPVFSLGSGIGKLALVESLLRVKFSSLAMSWAIIPAIILFLFALMLAVSMAGEITISIHGEVWWLSFFRIVLGMGLLMSFLGLIATPFFLLFGFALSPFQKKVFKKPEIPKRPGFDRDYYTSSDLVPSFQGNASVPVHNRGSVLSDHTSYIANIDEFVGSLIIDILNFVGRPLLGTEKAVSGAVKRRQWRVLWLQRIRRIALLFTMIIFASYWQPQIYIPRFDPFIQQQGLKILGLGYLQEYTQMRLEQTPEIDIVINSLFIWIIYWLLSKLWAWWEADDLEAYFGKKPYQSNPVGMISFGFVTVVFIESAVMYLLGILTLWGSVIGVIISLVFWAMYVFSGVKKYYGHENLYKAAFASVCLASCIFLPLVNSIYLLWDFSVDSGLYIFGTLLIVWLIIVPISITKCFRKSITD